MIDAMGHELWMEHRALDQLYPVAHSAVMLGSIAQMLASYFGIKRVQEATMPWLAKHRKRPQTPAERAAATAAVVSLLPSNLKTFKHSGGEFIL